ncbi:MAG: hypothetical protein AAGB12_11405 [Pseudomonadota bacterium]
MKANKPILGDFIVSSEKQVLYFRASGTWNEWLMEKYRKQFYRYAKPLSLSPWCMFVEGTHWEMATPGFWEELYKIIQWSEQHKLTHKAIVLCDNPFIALDANTIKTYHQSVQVETFLSLSEAVEWLSRLGFDISLNRTLQLLTQRNLMGTGSNENSYYCKTGS